MCDCDCGCCGETAWISPEECGCAPWGCAAHGPSWWQPELFPVPAVAFASSTSALEQVFRQVYLPALQQSLTKTNGLFDLLTRLTPSRWPFDEFRLEPQSVSRLEAEPPASFTWSIHVDRAMRDR